MDSKTFKHPEDMKTYRILPEAQSFPNGFSALLDVPYPGNNFSNDPLDDKDLSMLLHAVESKSQNREVGWSSWTCEAEPCVGIYIAKSNGLWYWDQSKNAMLFVHPGEHFRKALLPDHRAAQGAPVVLVFVSRREGISKPTAFERFCRFFHLSEAMPERNRIRVAALECGARIQNTLYAVEALKLQAEIVMSPNRELMHQLLDLDAKDDVFAAVAIGYKASSIFARKTH